MIAASFQVRYLAVAFAVLTCVTSWLVAHALHAEDDDNHHDAARLRRPVGLVLCDGGKWLFTANRTGGSISTIDLALNQTVRETSAGRRLVDLAITPDERLLLAVDQEADELIVLTREGPRVRVMSRTKIAAAPTSVVVAPDGRRCYVASLWSRKLSIVELAAAQQIPSPLVGEGRVRGESNELPPITLPAAHARISSTVVATVDLPFAAGKMRLVDSHDGTTLARLIVSDAFGGGLAVLDAHSGKVLAQHALPGHNIRGLALSADGTQLLVAHQTLNSRTATNQGNVFWGAVMSNVVRSLPLDAVLAPQPAELPLGSAQLLGGPGYAAGDPADVAVTRGGDVLVALAGVGELAIRRNGETQWSRVRVGRHPRAIALSAAHDTAYVANEFSDTVAVVSVATGEVAARIPLGRHPELSPQERGEMLFYDARLSLDGWLSCHSCHTDGHTNGLTSDTFGDSSFGAAKRVPSLLGTGDSGPWGWNGGHARLEDQVRKSLETTMHSRNITDAQVDSLSAYLRSLPPPRTAPIAEAAAARDTIARGQQVFADRGCASCHAPPAFTSPGTYEVGLKDELGQSRFNPPSLRGVTQRTAYFHDKRAATLEDVFRRHGHPNGATYQSADLDALIAFLRSL